MNKNRSKSLRIFLSFFLVTIVIQEVGAVVPGMPVTEIFSMDISGDQDSTLAIGIGDVDGDGDPDLVVGNDGVNKLYLNSDSEETPFADAVGVNITDDVGVTESIALGDMDGDGDLDVVAGNFGSAIRLYLNNGTENPFANVLGTSVSDDLDDTTTIVLGDVDGDGDLDVVVGIQNQPTRLYQNNGTENPFANVMGVNITDDIANTTSIAMGDIDDDGDLDVVVGNNGSINRLYLNNGTENPFANVNGLNISEDTRSTLSIALGDMDGDGDLDVVIGNHNSKNRVYLNSGSDDPFANVNGFKITDDADNTSSLALGDLDGDGDLDVVAGNRAKFEFNRVYVNNGTETPFADVIKGVDLTDDKNSTHALALTDLDGDGDIDVITGNNNKVNRFYLNNASNGSPGPFGSVHDITEDADNTVTIALGDPGLFSS